ncbi:MAG: sugar-binding protein, partial [Bacteroidota bacterium]
MKKSITLLVLCGLSLSVFGQDVWEFTLWANPDTVVKEAISVKVDAAPVIDGTPEFLWDQASWNRAQFWALESNGNNNPTMTALPSDTLDHYMEWKSVWTDSAAYFLIRVVDDVLAYSDTRSAWWRQDGMEIYPYPQGVPTIALDRNDSTSIPWVNIFPDVSGGNTVDVQKQDDYPVEAAVSVNGAIVNYEIKIPNWTHPESRGSVPVNGDTMSLAMMINESDNTDPNVDNRDMKITWSIQGEAHIGTETITGLPLN